MCLHKCLLAYSCLLYYQGLSVTTVHTLRLWTTTAVCPAIFVQWLIGHSVAVCMQRVLWHIHHEGCPSWNYVYHESKVFDGQDLGGTTRGQRLVQDCADVVAGRRALDVPGAVSIRAVAG